MPEQVKDNPIVIKMTIDEALYEVKEWARSQPDSANASAALVYSQAMPVAKQEATLMGQTEADGERTQLLYVQCNLQYWRGDKARLVKEVIKDRIKELQ